MRIFPKQLSPMDATLGACKATETMLAKTQQYNMVGRYVSGVVAVPCTSLANAVGNAGLGILKAAYAVTTGTVGVGAAFCGIKRFNPLNLKHANITEAAIHLRMAVVDVALAVVALVTGLLGSDTQLTVLVGLGVKAPAAPQGKIGKLASKGFNALKAGGKALKAGGKRLKPSRRTLKIAGGVAAGAAAVTAGVCAANAYGYLAKDSRLAGVTVGNLNPMNLSFFSKAPVKP